jgi:hypothetical protein
MTYQELVTHIRRLPLHERLELLNVLALSLKDELNPPGQHGSTLERIRGIAKPEGPPPTDEQIEEDYTNYLMEKYS